MGYSYEELERLANAVRNAWAANYNGGMVDGMSKRIGGTGDKAFEALMGDTIEVIGGSIFSGLPLRAIIAMKPFGHEEALRIQDGYAPFDMKPGFLAAARKKGKKHFVISFRHMTPGSTSKIGKVMAPDVYARAKKGDNFPEQMGTSEDPGDFALINSRGYQWQNGPYAGMTNVNKGTKHSSFRTFRVISENSAPNSWWHPGVEANDVIGATINYVEPYIKEGLKRAAKSEVIEQINQIFSQPTGV